ncbi:MAG: porin [Herbaspirillum sp.]|nr:porin [Herbaspirillum sp.]
MKNRLFVLAAISAFASIAQAQSSITIYGAYDGGLRDIRNADAAGNSKLTMDSNGTYYANRLGFRGVEDLGDGLNAHFNLESGFNSGSGALDSSTPTGTGAFFNRNAIVGLGGDWGTLDFGHQFSISFRTLGLYDPFFNRVGFTYTGIVPLAPASAGDNPASAFGGTRFNNDVQYTGKVGEITARVEYSFGGVAGGGSTNSAQAAGFAYAHGPLAFGGAYTRKHLASTAGSATVPAAANASSPTYDNTAWTLGAAYTIGDLRIAGGYNDESLKGALNPPLVAGSVGIVLTPSPAGSSQKIGWLGGSYDIKPYLNLTCAVYQTKIATAATSTVPADGKKNLFMAGLIYVLSKRATLYAEVDYTKLTGNQILGVGTAINQNKVLGISVGMAEIF